MSNQTPVQKSMADIEAMIVENEKQIKYYNEEGLNQYVLFKESINNGLNRAIQIITANLEYERDVIENAYRQGHFDGNDGCEMDFNDYYTKTYNNERKD